MRKTSSLTAAVVASLAIQGAAAAPAKTPDQQLVAGLEAARSASQTALDDITPVSPEGAKKAESALSRAIQDIGRASNAAASAVGALETSSVRTAVRQGQTLARQARSDVVRGRYATARPKLRRAKALMSAALDDFGVPLEKNFGSFVVARTYPWIPEFRNYSGLSATVEQDVTEVLIGAADRTTANAGEAGFVPAVASPLAITRISLAVFSDVIGRFTSGWCELELGLITCRMRPAMPSALVFSIAFGPRLPKGTKLLVKFRSANGDRSYATFTTR